MQEREHGAEFVAHTHAARHPNISWLRALVDRYEHDSWRSLHFTLSKYTVYLPSNQLAVSGYIRILHGGHFAFVFRTEIAQILNFYQ